MQPLYKLPTFTQEALEILDGLERHHKQSLCIHEPLPLHASAASVGREAERQDGGGRVRDNDGVLGLPFFQELRQ